MKFIIEIGEDELQLINKALDFYSRVGTGQFSVIIDHPTFQKSVYEIHIPKKQPEVGDRTQQGEILEIKEDKALINGSIKNDVWCKDPKWRDISTIKLSTDYAKYHKTRDTAEDYLYIARDYLYGDNSLGKHGSWGIFNPKVDDSCKVAFHIHQQIRHEFWKLQENKTRYTVDAYPADSCKLAGLPTPNFKINTHEENSGET